MKLYVVTYDGYDMPYGCEMYLYGVYDSKEKAENTTKGKNHMYSFEISEVELNKEGNKYIGGYYE